MEDGPEIRLDETVTKLCSRIHKAAAQPDAAEFASLRDEVLQRWRTQSSVLVAFSEFMQFIEPESVSFDEISWAAFFATSKVEKAQERAQRRRSKVESNRILRENQILKISMCWSPEVVQRYEWGKLGQSKIKLLSNCMKAWPRWDDFVGAANLVLMLRHCAAVTTAKEGQLPCGKGLVGPELDLKLEDLTAIANLSKKTSQWIYGEKLCVATVGVRAKDIDAWATNLDGTIAIQGRDDRKLKPARCLDTIQALNRWRPTDFSKYLLEKDENGMLMSRAGLRAARGPHIDGIINDRDSSAEVDDRLASSPNNSDNIPFPETILIPSSDASADCFNYAETPTTPPSPKTLNGPRDMLEVPEGVRPTALSLSTAGDTTCWPYDHGFGHGPFALKSQGSILDASSALQAEILEHHLDPTISTGMSKERKLQARRIATKDYSGSQLIDGNVSSGEVRSPESRNGVNRRKRKHASGRCKDGDRRFERAVERFGMDWDLETYEQTVDQEKEKVHWLPGAWTLRPLCRTPDVGPFQFVQTLPTLVRELVDHEFAKRLSDVKYRMAMAHFYRAYRYVQANDEMFVDWTDGLRESVVNLTPVDGRRTDSVVKQRLIDIVVWQSRREGKEADDKINVWHSREEREQAGVKINDWQRCGKKWEELILRLGDSSLLLVPSDMSNNWVRLMSEDEFSSLLTRIEARKSSFADSLLRASTIMEKLFRYATPLLIDDCPYNSMQPDQPCDKFARQQPEIVRPITLMLDQDVMSQLGAEARLR